MKTQVSDSHYRNLCQHRAALDPLEIASTNLSEKQMVGFVAGWKLAGETSADQMAQGTFDRMSEIFADTDRQDFHLGKFVGWSYYWQELMKVIP